MSPRGQRRHGYHVRGDREARGSTAPDTAHAAAARGRRARHDGRTDQPVRSWVLEAPRGIEPRYTDLQSVA